MLFILQVSILSEQTDSLESIIGISLNLATLKFHVKWEVMKFFKNSNQNKNWEGLHAGKAWKLREDWRPSLHITLVK